MEKTESNASYDDRRKILTLISKEKVIDDERGTLVFVNEGKYSEQGIRDVIEGLEKAVKDIEKRLKENNDAFEKVKDLEDEEEIQRFKEVLEKVKGLDQKNQLKQLIENDEALLKSKKKELNLVKDVIGTRLKL